MMDATTDSARERMAQIALVPLLLVVIVSAALCRWHTPFCVDNRTYVEMIDGVAHHGLPYAANGPGDRFPELQVRWLEYHRGRLWGSYPPVYAYFAAPFYLIGGLRLVTQLNIAMLAVLALGVYALARRLTDKPLAGTAAAYLTVAATHVWTFSFDVSPYTLMITAGTWSVYFAVRSLQIDPARARTSAAIAGLLGMFAAGAQLLSLPIVACTLLLLFLFRRPDETALMPAVTQRWPLETWMPSRESIMRGIAAVVGALAVLFPIAVVNRVRFATWNPMGSGSCVWQSCTEGGLSRQGLGSMLHECAPFLVWLTVVAAIAFVVRKSRSAVVAVWVIAACSLIPPSPVRAAAMTMLSMTTAFLFDLSWMSLGVWKPPDKFGNFLGPFLIKSMFQSAPVLLVAAAVRFESPAKQREAWMVGLPVLGLLLSLAMRGAIAPLYALGFPYLDLRYVTPALPLLAVLTVAAVRDLPWSRWYLGALAVGAVAFWAWNHQAIDDIPLLRRVVVLRVSLAIAAVAFVFVLLANQSSRARWRHAAMVACVAGAVYGVGINLGVDLRAWRNDRAGHDLFSNRLQRLVPQRFAVLGLAGPGGLDSVVALRPTHDIEYADIAEVGGRFERFRGLVEYWMAEQRPIFVIMPDGFASPWPDISATVVASDIRLYRLTPRT